MNLTIQPFCEVDRSGCTQKKSNKVELMKRIQSKGDTFYQLNLRQSTKGSVQCVFLFLFEVRNLFRQFTEKVIHNPCLFMKVTTVWVPVYVLSESNQNVSFRGLLYLALDFSVPLTSGPHPSLICVLCMVEYYFWRSWSVISKVWKKPGARLVKHRKSLQESASSVFPVFKNTWHEGHCNFYRGSWKSGKHGQMFTCFERWELP